MTDYGYGLWPLVVFNSLLVIAFATGTTGGTAASAQWRSNGAPNRVAG